MFWYLQLPAVSVFRHARRTDPTCNRPHVGSWQLDRPRSECCWSLIDDVNVSIGIWWLRHRSDGGLWFRQWHFFRSHNKTLLKLKLTQTQKYLFVICINIHTITMGVWNPWRVYLAPRIYNIYMQNIDLISWNKHVSRCAIQSWTSHRPIDAHLVEQELPVRKQHTPEA